MCEGERGGCRGGNLLDEGDDTRLKNLNVAVQLVDQCSRLHLGGCVHTGRAGITVVVGRRDHVYQQIHLGVDLL